MQPINEQIFDYIFGKQNRRPHGRRGGGEPDCHVAALLAMTYGASRRMPRSAAELEAFIREILSESKNEDNLPEA